MLAKLVLLKLKTAKNIKKIINKQYYILKRVRVHSTTILITSIIIKQACMMA